jgi:hypothetical protein
MAIALSHVLDLLFLQLHRAFRNATMFVLLLMVPA